MTIYRFSIHETPEGYSYLPVEEFEVLDGSMEPYIHRLDKIIRMDIPSHKYCVFVSDDKQRLEDFYNGVATQYHIDKNGLFMEYNIGENTQGIFLVDKDGKAIETLVINCSICGQRMNIKKYISKGETKQYEYCPKCDKNENS